MRRYLGSMVTLMLVASIMLSPATVAQIEMPGQDYRVWLFGQSEEGDGPLLSAVAAGTNSPDQALDELESQIDDDWPSRYVDSPELQSEHKLDLWCYMFVGDAPKTMPAEYTAWLIACPVDLYIYFVVLYNDDIQPAIEVVEDLILYDDPEIPEGWIDVTEFIQ